MDSRQLPTWTIRFGHDDRVIAADEGPADDCHPPHVYVEFGGLAVVTVSSATRARALLVAAGAHAEWLADMRERNDVAR